jgi:hypothetical protein
LPPSTTSSFSMRCAWSSSFARSFETPGGTVTSSLRHQRGDRLIEVLLEADVARREDADGRVVLDHGHAADVVLAHHAERLAQRLLGAP